MHCPCAVTWWVLRSFSWNFVSKRMFKRELNDQYNSQLVDKTMAISNASSYFAALFFHNLKRFIFKGDTIHIYNIENLFTIIILVFYRGTKTWFSPACMRCIFYAIHTNSCLLNEKIEGYVNKKILNIIFICSFCHNMSSM